VPTSLTGPIMVHMRLFGLPGRYLFVRSAGKVACREIALMDATEAALDGLAVLAVLAVTVLVLIVVGWGQRGLSHTRGRRRREAERCTMCSLADGLVDQRCCQECYFDRILAA